MNPGEGISLQINDFSGQPLSVRATPPDSPQVSAGDGTEHGGDNDNTGHTEIS